MNIINTSYQPFQAGETIHTKPIPGLSPIDNNPDSTISKLAEIEKLSRDDIIGSQDLSPDKKLEMLGIEKMTTDAMSKGIAEKLITGEM